MITRDKGYSDFINLYDKSTIKCYNRRYSINYAFKHYIDGTDYFPEWLEGEFIVDYTYLKRRT